MICQPEGRQAKKCYEHCDKYLRMNLEIFNPSGAIYTIPWQRMTYRSMALIWISIEGFRYIITTEHIIVLYRSALINLSTILPG